MSNHLTDAQYAAFIDRLVACRQAEDDAKEDTKAVYTELAEAGEDKTVAGLFVRDLRMTEKDRTKANLRGAAAEAAAERYRRGKASHVRVRESEPEHDADGVIIEPEATMLPQTGGTETLVANSPDGASEKVGGFPVPAAPLSRGGTGGEEGDQTSQPANVGGVPDATAGETAPHTEPVAIHAPDMATVAGDRSEALTPAAAPVVRRPGDVWTESTPAEPVRWHEYLRCFPEHWGPALGDIKDSIRAEGVRDPIVKISNDVLDGRARYTMARELLVEYPVKEYDGSDPLLDVIRWNLEARDLRANERKLIAGKLIKLCPDRGEEITTAFGLDHERAAAE